MNSVLKGSSYVLVHAPDILMSCGTTQTTERIVNPSSQYLAKLPDHLRSFDDAVAYLPNQVYIGGKAPCDLAAAERAVGRFQQAVSEAGVQRPQAPPQDRR